MSSSNPITQSVHHRFERLRAAPNDPRIRQIWGQAAVDYARAKDWVLEVDIGAWRACTASDYDNYWDVRPDSDDMKQLLRDDFVVGDFFLNLGTGKKVEEALVLVLELIDAFEPEEDGYRSVMGFVGTIQLEPLVVGSFLSWGTKSEALVRLTKQGILEVLNENMDPIDLDNAYCYADVSREPPLSDAQVAKVHKLLQQVGVDDDDLKVLVRLLDLAFARASEAELTAPLAEGSEAAVRAGSVVLALSSWARRTLERERIELLEAGLNSEQLRY